jgi:hypothetical protein
MGVRDEFAEKMKDSEAYSYMIFKRYQRGGLPFKIAQRPHGGRIAGRDATSTSINMSTHKLQPS